MKKQIAIFILVCSLLGCWLKPYCAYTQTGQRNSDSNIEEMKQNYKEWLSNWSSSKLFVEYDPSPIALDILNPRFTWISDLEGRARSQSAYHLLVSSDRVLLEAEEGDVWDTGIVISDQSAQVIYEGAPLESNREYFWKVRIRDESGKLYPYSEPATFSTGLLNQEDWSANWIGRGDPDEIIPDITSFVLKKVTEEVKDLNREARSPLFRHQFIIDKKIQRARLFIAGLGFYELRLNGSKVGDFVLAPARTDFRESILYDTYDITMDLQTGTNALGIILGNGWFNGQKKYWGWQMQWYGSPRAMLQLVIEYEDGSKQNVVSDGSWKTSWSPITFNCMYDGEHYDARLETDGWDKPGFDDSLWSDVNEVQSPGGELKSSLHEPGKVTQIIKPIAVYEPRPDTFVFDLGQNIAGRVKLKTQGKAGTKVKLKFAEQLHPDGMIDPSSSRAAVQEDQYILKGKGIEEFEPRFTYHGFQYVQVTGYPGKPALDAIEGRFIQNAVLPSGSFSCSNDLINRIHLSTVQSQRSNLQMGVPTDDTQRPERQGWGGDALMTAQEAMLNVTVQRIYAKWFRDFHDQQDDLGRLGFITPRPGIKEDLVWSSAFVIMPWYQYVYYGDTAVLAENYDSILKYMNYLATQGRADIHPKEKGDNPYFPDAQLQPIIPGHLQQSQWGDHLSLADEYHSRSGLPLSISTAIYYRDIQAIEKMARVLGKIEHAEKFRHLGKEVKKAFNNKFLNRKEGYYDDRSQSAQTWPLFFGMVPEDLEKSVFNTLINDIVDIHNTHPTTGYVGTKFMIDLLSREGREDLVWKMALNTDFPSWGYSLRNGRTTITEKWADGGSQNHVVLGAAIDPWFYNVLAGIRPDEKHPGFKKFIIDPYIPETDLDWVKASVNTIHGVISSSWQKKGNKLQFDITIPANTSASIYLPAGSEDKISENGKPLSKAQGVKKANSSNSDAILEVGPGSYRFLILNKAK